MHKKFLNRSQWLLCFLCVVASSLLHSMEDIIAYRIISSANYDMHRTFALVSKACNKVIENKYRPCKKEIERFMSEKGTPLIHGKVSWNKDFSQCAWIKISDRPYSYDEITYGREPKKIELTLVGFFARNIKSRNGVYDCVCFPTIEDDWKLFFNEGAASLHAFGHSFLRRGLTWKGVILLSLNLECYMLLQRECFIEAEKDVMYNFDILFNLPVLMKALLQSTKVKDYFDEKLGWTKLYNITGATIPEDYRFFKKHPLVGFVQYGLYNDLPGNFRKAIDRLYEEQQHEKRIIEWERNNIKKL